MIGLDSGNIGTNTNSGKRLKSSKGSGVKIGSGSGSKLRSWNANPYSFPHDGMWKDRMIDLDSGSVGTNTDSGIWVKSSKVQESKLVQESGPYQEIKTQVHIHFPTTESDFWRLVIQVQEWQAWEPKLTLKYCSSWVTKHESILIQEFELDHKFEDQSHIFVWVQFHKNENLSIYQWDFQILGFRQVQMGVLKWNPIFQNNMILRL